MKGMENINGVKNHNPVMLTFDFMDANKIIVIIDIKKLYFRFFVWSFIIINKIIDVITVHSAGRNL